MAIDKKIIDELLKDYEVPEDLIGEKGILKQLTKSLIERALEAEMADHLGYEKHSPDDHHSGNSRNGHSKKKIITDSVKFRLKSPVIAKVNLNPKSSPNAKVVWMDSMTRSSPYMPVA